MPPIPGESKSGPSLSGESALFKSTLIRFLQERCTVAAQGIVGSFEPAARVAYGDSDTEKIEPFLEWYSELGSLPIIAPAPQQVHQLFPGIDLKISDHLLWSVGAGVGLTSLEPRLVYKSRLEFSFGRRK
jgi:hypothetical protein